MTQPYHMSEKDDWGTPGDFFNILNSEFHFAQDVCATATNALCADFITPERNGLLSPWSSPAWCNPPYSQWEQWVGKAVEETKRGVITVMLLASRTDVKCFHTHIWDRTNHRPYPGREVRFVKGRLRFVGAPASAPFPSMLVIFRPT